MESRLIPGHVAEGDGEHLLLADGTEILAGPGFTGPDGRSIMPDYRDSLTFAELVDLVAYIKSLGGGEHGYHHHEANAPQEQTAGLSVIQATLRPLRALPK